jgi:hypothetical protein
MSRADGIRFDSWKEIAYYPGTRPSDDETLRRRDGLPIHRVHLGDARASLPITVRSTLGLKVPSCELGMKRVPVKKTFANSDSRGR